MHEGKLEGCLHAYFLRLFCFFEFFCLPDARQFFLARCGKFLGVFWVVPACHQEATISSLDNNSPPRLFFSSSFLLYTYFHTPSLSLAF